VSVARFPAKLSGFILTWWQLNQSPTGNMDDIGRRTGSVENRGPGDVFQANAVCNSRSAKFAAKTGSARCLGEERLIHSPVISPSLQTDRFTPFPADGQFFS